MNIQKYRDVYPTIHRDAFIHENSTIIGKVKIGKGTSVWPGVVIRGDVNSIEIGEFSNIQDNSLLHVTTENNPLIIGNKVTVGHKVTLHSCTIEDECLIGMDACIMDNAVIGAGSLIAAGTVIIPGTIIPPNSFVVGSPGKVKATLTETQKKMVSLSWHRYLETIYYYNQNNVKGFPKFEMVQKK